MLLRFLGRGSAFNVKEGNNSAYIIEKSHLLLIDCGEGIFERIVKSNILNGIESVSIIITHVHSDHCGSLSSLLYFCYYIKHIVADVYYPDDELRNLLKILGNVESSDYNFIRLNLEEDTNIGFAKIRPIKVKHRSDFQCYGYIIYYKHKTIWYSGDCNGVSDVIDKYNIDEFYQDTCLGDYEGNVHTSLRMLCEAIPKDRRSNIYCMHIDCDELVEKAENEGFNVVKVNYV